MPNVPKFVHLKGEGIIIALDAIASINTDNKTVTLKGESFAHSLQSGDDYHTLVDFIKADLLNPEGV
jgi:hypothetical protein